MQRFILCLTFLSIAILFSSAEVYAQKKKPIGRNRKAKFEEKFLNKQVWIGFRTGANLTKAVPIDRFSAFSSTINPGGNDFDKTYTNFSNKGGQAGLEITFFYKMVSLSFQPGFRRMNFEYSNNYKWTDPTNASNTLEQKYTAIQKLDYLEFPLLFRLEPLQTKIRPYVQLGWYYGRLNNAFKVTSIRVIDQASGGTNEYISQEISTGAKELFIRSNMGWVAGAGASVPIGNARIAIDVNYIRNTHNITSVKNRYSNERLTGSGDVLDNLQVRNISASVSVLIPLRFVILKENYKVN